jgi:hypothetical protein
LERSGGNELQLLQSKAYRNVLVKLSVIASSSRSDWLNTSSIRSAVCPAERWRRKKEREAVEEFKVIRQNETYGLKNVSDRNDSGGDDGGN